MKKNYEMDMCSGPILGKLLTFTIPLIFSGILQLLFNAADDRCGTLRGQPVSGGGGFHNGADQPDDQYLYRTVRGCQCYRGEILRSEAGKRRAGYDPYGHGAQHRQRSFSDRYGPASLTTDAGTHGNTGRCDR